VGRTADVLTLPHRARGAAPPGAAPRAGASQAGARPDPVALLAGLLVLVPLTAALGVLLERAGVRAALAEGAQTAALLLGLYPLGVRGAAPPRWLRPVLGPRVTFTRWAAAALALGAAGAAWVEAVARLWPTGGPAG
jgi:hypothetical protein